MTKQELKTLISELGLENKFEAMLMELVEGAQEITPQFLNAVANILEQYADYSNNVANSLDQIASTMRKTLDLVNEIDNKELQDQLQVIADAQEQALANINRKVQELKQ